MDKQQFVAAVNAQVAELAAANNSPSQIVSNLLANDSIRPLITEGRKAGMTEAQIVEKLGGTAYKPFADANRKVEESNPIANAGRGAAGALGDMKRGIGRTGDWMMGNDAGVAYSDRLQAQAEADPTRMAVDRSTSGQVGRVATQVAPNLLAAAATGGASLPAQAAIQAGVGGVMGAMDPHGNPIKNAGVNAALSGVAAPAGAAVGKGAATLLKNASEKAGTRAATLESRALNTSDDGIDRTAFNKGVAERLGLKDYDGPVDSTMVKTADANAKQMFEAASKGRAVQPTKSFRDFVSKTADEDLEESGKAIRRLVTDDQFKPGTFVSPGKWVEMRSKVAALARDAKGQDAHHIGRIVEKMDDIMANGRAPEQVEMLKQARTIWRNMQPVEDMTKKSGDTGNITWNQFRSSISKDVDQYSRGQAPLQDLSDLAKQLQPEGKLISAIKGSGMGKALGGVALDMIPMGNTIARTANIANSPTALRGAESLLRSASGVAGNKTAQQLIAQLAAKGITPTSKR